MHLLKFRNYRSPHSTDPSIASHDELTVALLRPLFCPAHPQTIMKVLFVLTSHDELGNTGKKTGFWLEEFAAPYVVFTLCACTHLPLYVMITLCTCTHLPLVAPYVVPCARCAVCTCTHTSHSLVVPHRASQCHVCLCMCIHFSFTALSRPHMCNLPLTVCACASVAFTVRRVNMCICMSARLMANSSDLAHN
jgi:hypothetical protein